MTEMNNTILAIVVILSNLFLCYGDLSEDKKTQLLEAHNSFRQIVSKGLVTSQPPAADMLKLIWSSDSASKAQALADKCSFSHDSMSDRTYGDYQWVGQNIAMFSGQNISKGIELWFNEVTGYSYTSGTCSGISCGHYTQLMWAKSKELGCGVASCPYSSLTILFLVCNYAPGGNTNDEKPYQVGDICSKCPIGTTCIDGLCN